MKFHYGTWVVVKNGFYKDNRGHIVDYSDGRFGLGGLVDLYQVLLDIPKTADREYFARNTSAVTIEVQESEIESLVAMLPGVFVGKGIV